MEEKLINKDNYKQYKFLNDIRLSLPCTFVGTPYYNYKIKELFTSIGLSIGAIYFAGFIGWAIGASVVFGNPAIGIGYISLLLPIALGFDSLYKKCNIALLKKEHPDIDVKINNEKLKKELDKYEEDMLLLSLEKEETSNSNGFTFDELTEEEKIEFLKAEKEFWENVAIEENIEENIEDSIEELENELAKSKVKVMK